VTGRRSVAGFILHLGPRQRCAVPIIAYLVGVLTLGEPFHPAVLPTSELHGRRAVGADLADVGPARRKIATTARSSRSTRASAPSARLHRLHRPQRLLGSRTSTAAWSPWRAAGTRTGVPSERRWSASEPWSIRIRSVAGAARRIIGPTMGASFSRGWRRVAQHPQCFKGRWLWLVPSAGHRVGEHAATRGWFGCLRGCAGR